MTTLPLLDHPVVLAAAGEMARESILTCCDVDGDPRYCNEEADAFRTVAQVHARLLCSLTRPASRDFWTRWGRSTVEGGDVYERAAARMMWSTFRDDPDQLARAILATLGATRPSSADTAK